MIQLPPTTNHQLPINRYSQCLHLVDSKCLGMNILLRHFVIQYIELVVLFLDIIDFWDGNDKCFCSAINLLS